MKLNYGIRLAIVGEQDLEVVQETFEKLKKFNFWRDIDYVTGNLGMMLCVSIEEMCIPDMDYNHLLVFDDGSDEVRKALAYARKNNIPIYMNTSNGFNERIVIENIKTYKPLSNDYTVYVGRGSHTCNYNARLGNPFTVEQYGRGIAIQKYKEWVEPSNLEPLAEHLKTIKDKRIVLLCWCKPNPCHADIIKEMLLKLGV